MFVIKPIKSIEADENIIDMVVEKDLLMVLTDYINIFIIQNNKQKQIIYKTNKYTKWLKKITLIVYFTDRYNLAR
ncbi:hypothetical protein CPIN18020_0644 [Campylobacter pinnipediorum subsp. caledonicus]|uniref:hypothetical protein n=1 Tax=Campylobacter pinnipediorum TaxID=1965231 RepID=UPI000994A4CE|nr:hypothetical protein [Campylobacter pinnipediorum]AQW85857.1 hypothetical protein CPIN18020_0644 [Campylobacter pinnipediorum subsp. caledonicus]